MITGATSGFGKACAEIFAKNNWNLILTGRRLDRLEALKKKLIQFGVDIIILNFDIRDVQAVKEAVLEIPTEVFSKIEILINNAGLAAGRDAFQDGNLTDWEAMIDTNIKGLLYVSQQIIPAMISNQSGHIINISSIAGKEVYPSGNVYCATKHAVEAISKSMRMDLLQYGIKVTNIAPGAAETEFSLVRFKGNETMAKQVYQGYTPLSGQDIAEIIYFSASLPKHVCINDLVVTPAAQASSTLFDKKLI
jgi:3-hydroxy acid dehydrogenase/malonic semialdehyde reductase